VTKRAGSARRLRRRAAIALAALASTSLVATPANAQFDIVLTFVSKGYDAYKLILNKPSDLSVLQALIAQSKTQIIAEIDGITAASIAACAQTSVDTFQIIDQLSPDNQQAFALSADQCVNDAQAQIGAVTDKKAIDKMGFALNLVGPIALAARAHVGLPTDALRLHILQANHLLISKLAPICDVSIDNPDDLPTFSGSVTGHGACYNFTVSTPARVEVGERGGVFYLTHGLGRAFLYWPLGGKSYPDDDVLWWRGHTAYFPRVDFSIAIAQVMQGTSWQLANVALDRLEPDAGPVGSPVAMTMYANLIYKPMDAFLAGGSSSYQGTLNPVPSGPNPSFSGWKGEVGAFVSVAAGANADGRIETFGISRIGGIYHRWERSPGNSGSWSGMAQMDGQLSSIAVARNADGTLQVFGANPFGNIFTRKQILGGDQESEVQRNPPLPATDSWTGWKQLDGALVQVGAVTTPDGLIHLLGVNSAGQLFHRQQIVRNATDPSVSGGWSGWEQIDVPAPMRAIATTIDLGGRVNIFCLTRDDRIFQRVKLGSGSVYTGWAQIPGSVHNIAAMKQGGGSGMLVLMGIAADGRMYRATSYGLLAGAPGSNMPGPWNAWAALPSPLRRLPPIGPVVIHPVLTHPTN
jgi:hypothetical protein